MPYAHKTSQPTKDALRKGDLALAVNSTENLGPTSATGYYNTIHPPVDGYAIYSLGINNKPIVMTVTTDDEVIRAANTLGGSVSTKSDALSYLAGRTSTWILHNYPNNIVIDGLALVLNAGNLTSYPTTGNTFYDLIDGGNSCTLENGVGFNSPGYLEFDGVDDYILIDTYTFGNGNWTVNMLVNGDSISSSNLLSNTSGGPVANAFGFASNKIHYRNYDGAWQTHNGNTTLSTSRWYYLTWVNYKGATNSDGEMKMYVNGVADSSLFNSYVTNGGPCNAIGSNWFNKFNGRIASTNIYTSSLEDEEILQNYHQSPIVTDDLVFAIDAGNLVSYEDRETTTYSLTGSDNGTLYNGVGFNSSNGGFWEFDGVDDEIIVPGGNSSNLNWGNTDSFSMETWVQIVEMPTSGNTMGIFVKAYRVGIDLYFPTVNTMVFRCGTRNSQQSIVGQTGGYTPLGVWSHVVFTYEPNSSTGVKLYINGELNNSISNTSQDDFSNNTNYTIGGNEAAAGTPRFGNIRTSTARMYNKTLSASEIKQNYNANINKFN